MAEDIVFENDPKHPIIRIETLDKVEGELKLVTPVIEDGTSVRYMLYADSRKAYLMDMGLAGNLPDGASGNDIYRSMADHCLSEHGHRVIKFSMDQDITCIAADSSGTIGIGLEHAFVIINPIEGTARRVPIRPKVALTQAKSPGAYIITCDNGWRYLIDKDTEIYDQNENPGSIAVVDQTGYELGTLRFSLQDLKRYTPRQDMIMLPSAEGIFMPALKSRGTPYAISWECDRLFILKPGRIGIVCMTKAQDRISSMSVAPDGTFYAALQNGELVSITLREPKVPNKPWSDKEI